MCLDENIVKQKHLKFVFEWKSLKTETFGMKMKMAHMEGNVCLDENHLKQKKFEMCV